MVTVQEFDKKFDACKLGDEWGQQFSSMEDAFLRGDENPQWIIWDLTRPGVLTSKELQLFSCFCARQNWDNLYDDRSRHAVEIAESYINHEATLRDVDLAISLAKRAVIECGSLWCAGSPIDNATRSALCAIRSIYSISEDQLSVIVEGCALYAAEVNILARSDTRSSQLKWLRENTKPDFERAMKGRAINNERNDVD